jgi:hypothetical protein
MEVGNIYKGKGKGNKGYKGGKGEQQQKAGIEQRQ